MRRKKIVPCATCGVELKRYRFRDDAKCPRCHLAYKLQWNLDHQQEKQLAERARVKAMSPAERSAHMARIRDWQKANPEKTQAYDRNYRRRVATETKTILDEMPCLDCGVVHSQEHRFATIRRMLPATIEEIREVWPCFWLEDAGYQQLRRDLKAFGATLNHRTWEVRMAA